MTRNAIVSLIFAIVVIPSACLANNNLFLPGDAFFPTVLTKSEISRLQSAKTGERRFAYSSFAGYDKAFCGYAGYLNATVPTVDDPFIANLAKVYARIRTFEGRTLYEQTEDGKTELIETNGIRVLLYPQEFEFPRHTLGLRYNEKWIAEVEKFGHRRSDIRLCCLIADPDAVERSWRDADLVPALKVTLPNVPLTPVPETEAPVVVQGSVKAIVIGSNTLKKLFRPSDDDAPTIYVVDSKGITELFLQDGKWERVDFE